MLRNCMNLHSILIPEKNKMCSGVCRFKFLVVWLLLGACFSGTGTISHYFVVTRFLIQLLFRSIPAVVFWQWVNQSFNAIVNYTNRNANSPVTTTQLGVAYVSATASAMITAFSCKAMWANCKNPFVQRYVPFAAVASANCVNIPLMRQMELKNGIEVTDENGKIVGKSRAAAVKGISQVVFSRIVMAAPGMLVLPIIMRKLEKYNWMKRITYLHGPIQTVFVGCL